MKMMRLIPCGLLALLAQLWLPVGSGAQGTVQTEGRCKIDWVSLPKRLASGDLKERDRVIEDLHKLLDNCGNVTKPVTELDRSSVDLESLLRSAKKQRAQLQAQLEQLDVAHRRVKMYGNTIN